MSPIPVIYLLILMVVTTLTVAESVGIVQLLSSDPDTPPPTWLRRVTYGCLAKITCMKIPKGIPRSPSKVRAAAESNGGIRLPDNVVPSDVPTSRGEGENGSREMIQKEYQFIAAVVDKFFAGLFLLLLVASSVILLYAYPHVRNSQDFPPADKNRH